MIKARASQADQTSSLLGVISTLASVLITSKNAETRYLVPAITVSALLLPVAVHMVQLPVRATMLGGVALAILLAKAVWFTPQWIDNLLYQQKQYAQMAARADELDCRRSFFYRATSLTHALSFGNRRNSRRHSADLARLYPDAVTFDIFEGRFSNFGDPLSDAEVQRLLPGGQPLCLIGSRELPPSLAIKPDVAASSADGAVWRSWWGTDRKPRGMVQKLYILQSVRRSGADLGRSKKSPAGVSLGGPAIREFAVTCGRPQARLTRIPFGVIPRVFQTAPAGPDRPQDTRFRVQT